MSCPITPGMDPETKIQIMMANEAMNMYRRQHYGMSSCKVGYEYSYLADLKLLLEVTNCLDEAGQCITNCSYTKVKERINTL